MKTFTGGFDFYPEAGKTFEERTREYLERQLSLLASPQTHVCLLCAGYSTRGHTCAYCVLGTGQGNRKHRN